MLDANQRALALAEEMIADPTASLPNSYPLSPAGP